MKKTVKVILIVIYALIGLGVSIKRLYENWDYLHEEYETNVWTWTIGGTLGSAAAMVTWPITVAMNFIVGFVKKLRA